MPGLSLESRHRLVNACERRVLDGDKALTPVDARVLRALCLDFHNGATGRCDPGYRAIAAKAPCAVSTVGPSLRRLEAAGFLTRQRRWLRVGGRVLRWTFAFMLAAIVPASAARPEPFKVSKALKTVDNHPRSVAAQLAYLRRWAAERGA